MIDTTQQYQALRKPNVKDMHNTELLKACQQDTQLLNEFFKENIDFIFSIIGKYKGSMESIRVKFRVEEEEILQHAYIGVMTALREFDFERGTKFTTYVVRPILWEINQFLYSDSQQVRLSRKAVNLIKEIKQLETSLGYAPPFEELADMLGVPLARIQETVRFVGEMESIDVFDNKLPEKASMSVSPEEQVVTKVYTEQLLESLRLNDFEREVLRLFAYEYLNHSQISTCLRVYPMVITRTLARIRQRAAQNLVEKEMPSSKYVQEIHIIESAMKERGRMLPIEEIKELLDQSGFESRYYTTRLLYYIRQKSQKMLDQR